MAYPIFQISYNLAQNRKKSSKMWQLDTHGMEICIMSKICPMLSGSHTNDGSGSTSLKYLIAIQMHINQW